MTHEAAAPECTPWSQSGCTGHTSGRHAAWRRRRRRPALVGGRVCDRDISGSMGHGKDAAIHGAAKAALCVRMQMLSNSLFSGGGHRGHSGDRGRPINLSMAASVEATREETCCDTLSDCPIGAPAMTTRASAWQPRLAAVPQQVCGYVCGGVCWATLCPLHTLQVNYVTKRRGSGQADKSSN